jgi:DNA-directed RNA polymerase subunit RPC12/RpoP
MVNRLDWETTTIRCPQCGARFRALVEEQWDTPCPQCGYPHEWDEELLKETDDEGTDGDAR